MSQSNTLSRTNSYNVPKSQRALGAAISHEVASSSTLLTLQNSHETDTHDSSSEIVGNRSHLLDSLLDRSNANDSVKLRREDNNTPVSKSLGGGERMRLLLKGLLVLCVGCHFDLLKICPVYCLPITNVRIRGMLFWKQWSSRHCTRGSFFLIYVLDLWLNLRPKLLEWIKPTRIVWECWKMVSGTFLSKTMAIENWVIQSLSFNSAAIVFFSKAQLLLRQQW